MESLKKACIACQIEYHWWRIRRLRRRGRADLAFRIGLHRYEADALGRLFDVISGIRNLDDTFARPGYTGGRGQTQRPDVA